jgi:N-acetylglucosamine-6-sulfatase
MGRGHRIRGLLAALASSLALAAPAAAAPNIVFVLTDDQRWDTLFAMPTVQREIAARGVTFVNAFAVNPLCCPSRASFLTGQHSHSTGVYDNVPPYGGATSFRDSSTAATWLQGAGYRTAYVGKYLNGYVGTWIPFGWNRWVGYQGGYYDYTLNVDGLPLYFGTEPEHYSTDVLAREAVSFVESTTGPFFLVLAPYAPHSPMRPAPRHANAFSDVERWRPPNYNEEDVGDKPSWLFSWPRLGGPEETATDELRRKQLASLLAVDEAVRQIIDKLAASGRLSDTMIVFSSDNGLLWGEHRLRNRKVSAFEESIRIPLVVRYDPFLTDGRVETRLVTNLDLAPTFAELAGAAAPGVEGRSLVPLLARPSFAAPAWRESLLIEHLQGASTASREVPTYCAVRRARYKYVLYGTREEELYDLVSDPGELTNRAADPAYRRLRSMLRTDLKELCEPPPPGYTTKWLCTIESDGATRVLAGTFRADTICATRFAEEIRARPGDDEIRAGSGSDFVDAGAGKDLVYPGPGRDVVRGGAGDDRVLAADGQPDQVACGAGFDTVQATRRDKVSPDCERVRRAAR